MIEPWNDEALQERMAAKIVRGDNGCWLWLGKTIRGRAGIQYRGSAISAPRLSKIISDRAWPDRAMQACHSCDNPLCVNSAHIWWGSNQENAADASRKGRFPQQRKTHCSHGHALEGENVRLTKQGHRVCRECAARRQKAWKQAVHDSAAIAPGQPSAATYNKDQSE